jgi:alpha-aminoadipate/glutamate carrier protein LysW
MVTCPLCNADLDIEEDELDEGEEFTCDECGGNVRVASVGPLELEEAAEDEDEDDDDFLDDDDEDEEEEEESYDEDEDDKY